MKIGKPIYWNDAKKEIAVNVILGMVENGNSLNSILSNGRDKLKLPSKRVFNEWLDKDLALGIQYARACVGREDSMIEDIIEIADDSSQDYIIKKKSDGQSYKQLNPENIQRAKLMIETRKWALSKMNPKKFGRVWLRLAVLKKCEGQSKY